MNTTTLIIDEKVTIWRRSEVMVLTADLDKAKAEGKLKEFIIMSSFDYHDSDLLTETEETLMPIDNYEEPTIEVFEDDTFNSIYTNAR